MIFMTNVHYTKAIETGIVVLIYQVAVLIFVRKTKVSDLGTSERFLFELLPGAGVFFKHIKLFYVNN